MVVAASEVGMVGYGCGVQVSCGGLNLSWIIMLVGLSKGSKDIKKF